MVSRAEPSRLGRLSAVFRRRQIASTSSTRGSPGAFFGAEESAHRGVEVPPVQHQVRISVAAAGHRSALMDDEGNDDDIGGEGDSDGASVARSRRTAAWRRAAVAAGCTSFVPAGN